MTKGIGHPAESQTRGAGSLGATPYERNAAARSGGGGGLPAEHWSAAGYGETGPVVANDSPGNMQKNRRVELGVLPNMDEMLDLKSLIK